MRFLPGRRLVLAATACVVVGCGGKPDAPPGMSERQRDSAIGASSLPGAQGVRGALRVSDSAAARAARTNAAVADTGK